VSLLVWSSFGLSIKTSINYLVSIACTAAKAMIKSIKIMIGSYKAELRKARHMSSYKARHAVPLNIHTTCWRAPSRYTGFYE
jgi:hypothetical protein